jgi:formylglycine-generating enzyme required for sulfatase activity
VQFTDTSTTNPTMWQWDFNNDGLIDSTVQNPTFTYTQNGVYSVRLVASNGFGSMTTTKVNLIGVGFPTTGPTGLADMVPIAPGSFQMGSTAWISTFPYEAPVHQVTLTQPFWVGRHEVTQAQYQAVMGVNPSYFQGANAPNAPQRPVEQVSWHDARAYCAALTASEQAAGRVPAGYEYRLPTEAEWEYFCRAGTTTEYHTGNGLLFDQANFHNVLANSTYPSGQTAVVGSYAANPWGLHDVHGNVWEWVLDRWSLYPANPVIDPFTSGTGSQSRTFRGGCWHTVWNTTRSAIRSSNNPAHSGNSCGFRVVLAPVRAP